MKNIICRCSSFFLDRKGQALIEYAFILILIAVVVFLMLTGIGGKTNNYYSSINSGFSQR